MNQSRQKAPQTSLAQNFNRSLSALVSKVTETLLPSEIVTRLREGREWKHWISGLEPTLFDDLTQASLATKQNLFKSQVNLVEIEVHAKCNRVCSFCPNVIVDRRKNNDVTDAELLDRVFAELGSIDYRGQIKVARYSEPLSNLPYLYERIKSARKLVPNARLAIVTNTDYLKPAVLNELRDIGLNRIYMSLYPRPSEKWSLELARRYSKKVADKLKTPILTVSQTPVSVRCTYDYNGLELVSACINFDDYGTDRGNLMEQYTDQDRLGPCREPFETFVIDYTGSVMPCCNLRSDFPEHQEYIVGDLSQAGTSIFDVYAGRLAGWRKSMIGFDKKSAPCATCRHRDLHQNLVSNVSTHLAKRLYQIKRQDLL